jgi:hypothetical protein
VLFGRSLHDLANVVQPHRMLMTLRLSLLDHIAEPLTST